MHLPVISSHAGNRFAERVARELDGGLRASGIETLQINLGKVCNQACRHCHVDAGPHRTESMDRPTAEACLALLAAHRFPIFDITGGAPEMNPHFRDLVVRGRALGAHVVVRHNLTVMFEPGHEDLPEFFAAQGVEVVSSLPHYTGESTDRQRGKGVFEKSIEALQRLNAVGYGTGRADRPLHLVYNPVGAFLPGPQAQLEKDYKRELWQRHGVRFDRLFAFTNMPVKRFRDWLEHTSQLEDYQAALEEAFNAAALPSLMCRTMVSVSWDGRLYDCDFNQMLELTVVDAPVTLDRFDHDALAKRRIVTADHCFGCTAGAGFS